MISLPTMLLRLFAPASAILLLSGGVSAQVAGITTNQVGTGNCLDASGFEYEKGTMSFGGGTIDDCIAKCPSVHLVGVEDTGSSTCNCLYPGDELPDSTTTFVTFDSTDETGNGTSFPQSADATSGVTCYKSTRPQDTYLQFTSNPDLTLSGGIHTVRITYDRSVGWDWDVKYYTVFDDAGTLKCNFTDAAEIDPDNGGYLDAATEEVWNDIDPVGSYPRQNVTVKIDFNEPQEATFCVRTKLVDPFAPNPVVNYDEHIITVELTTDNIFQLEGEGVGLEANAANEAEEEFLYTLTAFECPDGYDRMAEGENNTVAQDGQIKLCVRTSDAEVELVTNSVNINVYQGDTDYTPILGMTNGDANNFLIAREGRVVTAANDTANDNGHETTRYSIQTVEQNFQEDESGNIPNIIFNGTADIDFAPTSRRLRARIVMDEKTSRKLATAAKDVPFGVSMEVPKRGSFDSDLQVPEDDAAHSDGHASKQGLPNGSYSSASSKGMGYAVLACVGAALALAF